MYAMERNLQRYDYKEWSSNGETIGAMVRSNQVLSMDDIYNAITKGDKLRDYVEQLRSETDKSVQNEMKKRIPAIEFQTITKGHRQDACVVGFTKYMSFDIDDTNLNYNEVKRVISNDNVLNPTLVFISPRGKLKFIVRDESINDGETLKFHQRTIWAYLYGKYGYVVDTQCKDLVRLTFLSSDPSAYYNPNATTNIDFKDGDEERVREVDGVLKQIGVVKEKKNVKPSYTYTNSGMQLFFADFANYCVANEISVLNTYNDWFAFGNYLRAAFKDDDTLLKVWTMCSCYGDGYRSKCCQNKLRYLKSDAEPTAAIGFIYNRDNDMREWLDMECLKCGINRINEKYTIINY